MDNILVGEDGAVTGLIDFEFAGSYPLWCAVGPPDWISNEWLDNADRQENELEGIDLCSSYISELDQPRMVYREEVAKAGEPLRRALDKGRELRLAASS
jgi:hypothetical protein